MGLGVFAGCGDSEYGGNAETSPSVARNEIINPANKTDRFSLNFSQRSHVIFPFVL